ncbi:metallophosphoesterase, partial [Desulfovibrio sp. OttesenSCG-928-G15]|nr:metallophosphoesterase [Desulfovibrio sp. OttesenSCG-928-G15]
HVSHLGGKALVSRIVDTVNAAHPDIFISLGDLTDKDIAPGSAEAALLRGIQSTYGSYGVLGNHEFYYNVPLSLQFHQDAGITLLRGKAVNVGPIRLIGTDDPEGVKRGYIDSTGREELLKANAGAPRYTVALYHQPRLPQRLAGFVDLQLSGHTHGGQAWPVNLYVRAVHPYSAWRQATLKGENGESELFVTHGAGFNGPPFRFLVPAEVVIIDITAAHTPQITPGGGPAPSSMPPAQPE